VQGAVQNRLRWLSAAGITTPLIATAFAFLVLHTRAGLIGQALWPIALAITAANLPFLMFSVGSAFSTLDPSLEEAAATLGAEGVQTFLFVTLPGMAPGILSGTIMIFVLGISEFLISLILTTVATQTLPVAIFGSPRGPVPPTLAAAAGLYIVAFIVVGILTSPRLPNSSSTATTDQRPHRVPRVTGRLCGSVEPRGAKPPEWDR
jgi:putative spermidine/putrescine transport system permease protein